MNTVLILRVPHKTDTFLINPAILASQGVLSSICFIDRLDWRPQDCGNLPTPE